MKGQAMTTATAAPGALREVYEAARERIEERRNVYQSYTVEEERRAWLENRALPRTGIYEPEFRAPKTPGEYFDDRIVERGPQFHGLPETPVLYAIAAAARESAAAAVREVKAARKLTGPVQWVVYRNLTAWKARNDAPGADAEPVVAAVLAEWSRLGLAEENPDGE